MPHEPNWCDRILRLVALSSTINTRKFSILSSCGDGRAVPAGCFSSFAVNQNVDPSPGVLLTPIWPSISWTNCFEIDRPNPVPPYLRVVEPSACVNALKQSRLGIVTNFDSGVADAEPYRYVSVAFMFLLSPYDDFAA